MGSVVLLTITHTSFNVDTLLYTSQPELVQLAYIITWHVTATPNVTFGNNQIFHLGSSPTLW